MSTLETVNRRVDDGGPLLLRDPPRTGPAEAYTVQTRVCSNPDCGCADMGLSIAPLQRMSGGQLEAVGSRLGGRSSMDDGCVELGEAEGFTPDAIAWISERLREQDVQEWLTERWSRSRGQVGDPAYPLPSFPDALDQLAAFYEVFPSDFDLTLVHERRLYLVVDQYCLRTGCPCDDVVVQFIDLQDGQSLPGCVRAPARRLQAVRYEGASALVRTLWSRLLREGGREQLRDRAARVRLAVSERAPGECAPGPVGRQAPKVGRNAPCPCGSGKKHKRCCAA